MTRIHNRIVRREMADVAIDIPLYVERMTSRVERKTYPHHNHHQGYQPESYDRGMAPKKFRF